MSEAYKYLGLNIVVSLMTGALVFLSGDIVDNVDVVDFVIEFLSAAAAFVMFSAACFIEFRPGLKQVLLSGLFFLQFGRSFDATDEVVIFPFEYWAVFGDAFTLVGELMLAFVAVRWIVHSNIKANTDPLTGLFNRRFHDQELVKLARVGDRRAVDFAIIALDLDNFKVINDQQGHAAGDVALVHTANVLRECSREPDIVSRVGGEEFEIIIRDICESDAAVIAERIRARLESTPPAGLDLLTASVGVAAYVPTEGIESLRARADAAVYVSKHAGKNRITIAERPGPPPSMASSALSETDVNGAHDFG